jgi:hypothetical protein
MSSRVKESTLPLSGNGQYSPQAPARPAAIIIPFRPVIVPPSSGVWEPFLAAENWPAINAAAALNGLPVCCDPVHTVQEV